MAPPYVAQLRVYEPLEAFEDPERRRWRAYAASGRAPATTEGLALERALAMPALVTRRLAVAELAPDPLTPEPCASAELEARAGPAGGPGGGGAFEHAYLAEVDGGTVVCPWSLGERMAEAVLAGLDGASTVLTGVVLPDGLRADAETVLSRRRTSGGRRRHLLSSTWSIPIRWFALFEDGEREFRAEGPTMRYRTEMSRARRRAARALDVLRRRLGPEAWMIDSVESLASWLEAFHPHSMVELDYGGVARLLGPGNLDDDRSAADITEVLDALSAGDGAGAARLYERVLSRWRAVHTAERAN